METVSNIAATASKMIWGEQNQNTTQANETAGQEPISGQQGKGTAGEPFDQGNSDITNKSATSSHLPTTDLPDRTATTTTSSGLPDSSVSDTTKSTSNPTMSTNPINAAQGGEIRPEHETDKTGVIGGMSNPSNATNPIPSESQSNPGVDPSSGAAPTHKQQGADKPSAAPTTGEEMGAISEKKDEAEGALKKDPNDHSGEPLKTHGEEPKSKETWEERRQSTAGVEGGKEHGKDEKGSGEEWVKTSGLAADGGDFDATKPGAGREADRLMEEKGIKKSDPDGPKTTAPAGTGEKEKVPLSQKLKEKLHIKHKDKS